MAESVGKRRSARTRLPSLKAELNESSRAMVVATPPSTREKGYLNYFAFGYLFLLCVLQYRCSQARRKAQGARLDKVLTTFTYWRLVATWQRVLGNVDQRGRVFHR